MRRWVIGLSVLVSLLVQLWAAAPSTTRRVPQDHATVQQAIDVSVDGDTVLLSSGYYRENINFQGKEIVVLGNAPDQVTNDGSQPPHPDSGSTVKFVSAEGPGSVLEGATVTGGSGTVTTVGRVGGGVYVGNGRPVIRRCSFYGNNASLGGGVGFWHVNYQYLDGARVEGCVIAGNGAGSYGGGLWLGYASTIVRSCTFYENTAADGGNITLVSFASSSTIVDCIVWHGSIYGVTGMGTISYCDIEGGWPSGVGNIDADPMFCGAEVKDFRIASTSPCVGNGENGGTIGALGIGCVAPVSEAGDLLPAACALHVFPNPFNASTTILIDLRAAAQVSLAIFDPLGRKEGDLLNGRMPAGRHRIPFHARHLAGGVYFCRLQAGMEARAARLHLMK